MYTWSRQRGPTSTASGIPAPMETGLAVGEDRPWTGDTLNGSANRGARGVIAWYMRKGLHTERALGRPGPETPNGVDRGPESRTRGRGISHVLRSYRSDARTQNSHPRRPPRGPEMAAGDTKTARHRRQVAPEPQAVGRRQILMQNAECRMQNEPDLKGQCND